MSLTDNSPNTIREPFLTVEENELISRKRSIPANKLIIGDTIISPRNVSYILTDKSWLNDRTVLTLVRGKGTVKLHLYNNAYVTISL